MRWSVAVLLSLLLCSCGVNYRDPTNAAIAGGVGGAAAGAGTGAIVGSVISSGDIAASAALGAGIGLPIGAAAAYYYVKSENDRELARYQGVIDDNAEHISATQAELDALREDIVGDSYIIQPASGAKEELYLGTSLGNPTR